MYSDKPDSCEINMHIVNVNIVNNAQMFSYPLLSNNEQMFNLYVLCTYFKERDCTHEYTFSFVFYNIHSQTDP